ncbi:MAG: hypothetical protein K0B81_06875, partial [Candidatus Cloacimonetes bacterium]|nr:hypothetical protein [Candidatus Cloacimonadota bacterium]
MKVRSLKILTCLSCLIVIVSLLSGAFLTDVPTEIIEPNGEILQIFSSGDEFYNRLHDAAGYTILKGPDAYHYYAVREGDALVPSTYRVSQTDPSMAALEPGLRISEQEYVSRRNEMERTGREWLSISPSTGVINNIVIYIRFADQEEFATSRQNFDNRFNSLTSASVRHYFQEVSYDQMDIISHHFPVCDISTNLSYQDPQPRNYYMPYHPENNPIGYESGTGQQWQRVHTLFRNAIFAIRDQVPSGLIIDSDNDGYLDNVTFIIRGNHSSGTWLWPRMAWDNLFYDTSINNKLLWQFTLQSENMSSVYVLSHETFHTKGVQGTGKFAPDLYTGYGYTPVGEWDLMAHGFVHMGAWMKYKYTGNSWISSIPEITASGTYTLNPLTSPVNNAYMIASPNADNQFFVVEYRKKEGYYENNLPGSGLLVYRIFPTDHGNNHPNRLEVYIYRPGGTVLNPDNPSASNGQLSRAHFTSNSGRASINDYLTNPTSFLRDGSVGGLSIYDVSEAGETISFKVQMELAPSQPTLRSPINGTLIDNFSNCLLEWNHVNAQSYSIEVWKNNPYLLIESASNIMDQQYVIQATLQPSTTYYWKVTAQNPYGSATSSTGIFATTNGMPIGPSEPIRPENGDPETDRTMISFEWPGSSNAQTYSFIFFRDDPYQELINISNLTEPSYIYNASSLEPQTLYRWMVSADNSYGSGWSPVWSFTTIGAPGPNEYWMNNDIVFFNSQDSRYFYDSLGPFGQYRNNEYKTMTFRTTIPNAQMMCKFLLYDIEEDFDYLYIYDGFDVSKPLIQYLHGMSTDPVTIVSNNSSGALTFKFLSNGTNRRDGWTAVLSLMGPPQNLTFTTGDRFAILNWEGIGSPDGYNVYRNDVLITTTPLTGNTYSDYYLLNGTTYVYYVKGVYDGIESGPSQSVTVVPAIDTEILIGTGTSSSIMPFSFVQSNSLTQQIYPNYLIGRQGTIEQITFFAASNYNNYTGQRHVKIWMGEVDDSYMDDEYWIPSDLYQLVFDGMIEFPIGPSVIEIPLSTHFEYNGGHLAIKAYRVYDPEGTAPPQYFNRSKCTWGVDEYKLAMVLMSNDQFDPENPPSDGHVYHTAIPDIRIILNPSTSTDHIFDVGAGTELHSRLPVSMNNRTSLSQTIYPAHNFAFQGNVKGIKYYSNFTEAVGNKQIRVWVGETGANNLSGGWISSNNLQLVFYGSVNFPAGSNTINIPFDTDYYYSGQNLVVMIERNFELFSYSDQNRFLTTSTGLAAQSRFNYGNSVPFSHTNPTGGYLTDAIPNTTFVFQLADEWAFEMGTRVNFSNILPMCMNWRNSLSQTIYLASEINAPGNLMITGISY